MRWLTQYYSNAKIVLHHEAQKRTNKLSGDFRFAMKNVKRVLTLGRYRPVKKDPRHFVFDFSSTDRTVFTVKCIVFYRTASRNIRRLSLSTINTFLVSKKLFTAVFGSYSIPVTRVIFFISCHLSKIIVVWKRIFSDFFACWYSRGVPIMVSNNNIAIRHNFT